MLTAISLNINAKILARSVEKKEGPFICPSCKQELVLHKGNIRIHHFKHKPPVTCSRANGETEQHLQAKLAIFDALAADSNVTELDIEKDCGPSCADVYARINGIQVAIEIQKSSLSVADITMRTMNYHKSGIYVLWVGISNPDLWNNKYSPSAWEKWCHAAYFGRVYYWESGQMLRAVHFGAHKLYVESRSWYETGGYEQSAGGYERTSKRYKTPVHGVPCFISRSFRPAEHKSWAGGTVFVPDCRLFVDIQAKWWT